MSGPRKELEKCDSLSLNGSQKVQKNVRGGLETN